MKSTNIEVIGSGCKKCKALFELTKEAVQELGIKNDVKYSTDVSKIIAMGVMRSPVLAIDGKSVLAGSLPDKEKLKEIISAQTFKENQPEDCSCGGKCQ